MPIPILLLLLSIFSQSRGGDRNQYPTATVKHQYHCYCQCPYGTLLGVAYTTENTTAACINACIMHPLSECSQMHTYACLGKNCAYSARYSHTSMSPIAPFECSCQCPYGTHRWVVYATDNTAKACIRACQNSRRSTCTEYNTYACLGENCAYSALYSHTSISSVASFRCSCQCPYGTKQAIVYSTEYTTTACIRACQSRGWNECTEYNTYACLGKNCAYSARYSHTSMSSVAPFECSCQCPYGTEQAIVYATEYTTTACIRACQNRRRYTCTDSKTYACLGTKCVFSIRYSHTSMSSIAPFECSCQCPYGTEQAIAYAAKNESTACIQACLMLPSYECSYSNTFACLRIDSSCSPDHNYSVHEMPDRYKCSCQCPYGTHRGDVYTTQNTPEACIDACRNQKYYKCSNSNTYVCLGIKCAYSVQYQHTSLSLEAPFKCSCQCPYAAKPEVVYVTENTTEGCIRACQNGPSTTCTNYNTYVCLGMNCAYSVQYQHTSLSVVAPFECICQCPYGIEGRVVYATKNTTEACIRACQNGEYNECSNSNTYVCLGMNCAYSKDYSHTSMSLEAPFECSCQCPYGAEQDVVYATENTTEGCIRACQNGPSTICTNYNTYVCLGMNCAYSVQYQHTSLSVVAPFECICQCPYGMEGRVVYATKNTTEACIRACQNGEYNECSNSNTYVCLGMNCAYSKGYSHTSMSLEAPFECSCQCPYGAEQNVVYATQNTTAACMAACHNGPSYECADSNTYVCLGIRCAYSPKNESSVYKMPDRYECSCQCPYGPEQGVVYAKQNTTEGCIRACQNGPSTTCTAYNTYACLRINCAYSDGYSHTLISSTAPFQCSCLCPYGSQQRVVYSTENTIEGCIRACQKGSYNQCTDSNTYVCLETNCAYSQRYSHTSMSSIAPFQCSCQCPHGIQKTVVFATENTPSACIHACRVAELYECRGATVYACLGTHCAYSPNYDHSVHSMPDRYECSCHCPYESPKHLAYAKQNTTEGCIHSCQNDRSYACWDSNTYACLGMNCGYSAGYRHTSMSSVAPFECSCQCPYGTHQTDVYVTENTTAACIYQCRNVSRYGCGDSNIYACLGTRCAYSPYNNYSVHEAPDRFECSCRCPYETERGVVYTTQNTTEACIHRCQNDLFYRCRDSNTYVCLGMNCAYSAGYRHTSMSSVVPFECTCQCPYGRHRGVVYATQNTTEACINACRNQKYYECTDSNTYVCFGMRCAFSIRYSHTSMSSVPPFQCSCQCPYGMEQATAYAPKNTTSSCIDACRMVPSYTCADLNTYVCLGMSCAYSPKHNYSVHEIPDLHECSCQCPHGRHEGVVYARKNSTEACIHACIQGRKYECSDSNTYVCLGMNCAYSVQYLHTSLSAVAPFECICQCPYGIKGRVVYATKNTTEACIRACQNGEYNECSNSNTYVCLGMNCAYSAGYTHISMSSVAPFECSCQCPYGSNIHVLYATENTTEACIHACVNSGWYGCSVLNAYACFGMNCVYSDGYSHTSMSSVAPYRCSCQSPYGEERAVVFAVQNTTAGCMHACRMVISYESKYSNVFACLGARCASWRKIGYAVQDMPDRYECSCQCPYGRHRGVVYATQNSTKSCLHACRNHEPYGCKDSNTYVCLGRNCAYSARYSHTSMSSVAPFQCSCQCPYERYRTDVYATQNTTEACIDACQNGEYNECSNSNTYVCLGMKCTYSARYSHTSMSLVAPFECSCQCPYGTEGKVLYAIENTTEGCVEACRNHEPYGCKDSNTYVCLGRNCAYSARYSHTSMASVAPFQCSCQCPYETEEEVVYARENSTESCVHACRNHEHYGCKDANTYVCLGMNCAYSSRYSHTSISLVAPFQCSCQCPYGRHRGVVYAAQNTTEGCIGACQKGQGYECTNSNTYACLGRNCAYSGRYAHSSMSSVARFECSCECPYGSKRDVAYATENTTVSCIHACQNGQWYGCSDSNTYACLGMNCTYSDRYSQSSMSVVTPFKCSCQCPYGTEQAVVYVMKNRSSACIDACRMLRSYECDDSSTYVCLGTLCAYSVRNDYSIHKLPDRYGCSCRCPSGTEEVVAYATQNSMESCLRACRMNPPYGCTDSYTYVCLGMDCTYSVGLFGR